MDTQQYIKTLEDLISEVLLPTFDKYYALTKHEKPELDVLLLSKLRPRQIPALFKEKHNGAL